MNTDFRQQYTTHDEKVQLILDGGAKPIARAAQKIPMRLKLPRTTSRWVHWGTQLMTKGSAPRTTNWHTLPFVQQFALLLFRLNKPEAIRILQESARYSLQQKNETNFLRALRMLHRLGSAAILPIFGEAASVNADFCHPVIRAIRGEQDHRGLSALVLAATNEESYVGRRMARQALAILEPTRFGDTPRNPFRLMDPTQEGEAVEDTETTPQDASLIANAAVLNLIETTL